MTLYSSQIIPPAPKGPMVSPLVITASRATDIPALHGPWLQERLRAGYCVWNNPFNARQSVRVSFEQCRVWVFFSKNPAPFLPYLAELETRGYQYYFHFTLNDYVEERLEPQIPSLATRIDTFKRLADKIGPERVIWRYDPLLLGNSLSVPRVLDRIDHIGTQLALFSDALVFSYLDVYQKSARALHKVDRSLRAPTVDEMHSLAQGIAAVNATWPKRLRLASCAEAVDLSPWGVGKNSCVDPAIIRRLCPYDALVQAQYGGEALQKQGSLLPSVSTGVGKIRSIKDKGQRKDCGCAPSKDIGAYNTCTHGCVYCYACQSAPVVKQVLARTNILGESLS